MKEDNIDQLNFKGIASDFEMDRRNFLKVTGSGIFILFTLWDMSVFAQERTGRSFQRLPKDFNAFFRIGEDSRITLYTGKIEMGQGVITSLPQMLADELDAKLDSVDIVMGDTHVCPWDMGTFGSMTTRFFGPPLRKAGAEGRRVLIELASEHFKIPQKYLATSEGYVYDKRNKRKRISYGELTKGKRIERKVKEDIQVKKTSEFKIMGKSFTRRDAGEKVTGNAKYTGDIQLPGMMYAKILRPPAHGAKLLSVDTSVASKIEGVIIISDGDFIAALHKYPDVAINAIEKVKTKYDIPKSELTDKTIFDHLLKVAPAGEVLTEAGNLKEGEKESSAVIEETYYDGYKAHSPMEPHTAIVRIDGNKVTVWASTQAPFRAKDEVANELGISSKNVHVISPFVGGGFGGKTRHVQVIEAARLAKLSGVPVQVAWTREDEFFDDSFRPAAVVKIKSGITENGKLNYWDYHVYYAGERGSQQFYNIPNHRTKSSSSRRGDSNVHPFATGSWRAPANNTNTFARESQIEIMAAKAGIDPLEFRLKNLKDATMIRVLKTAGEKFGWKSRKKSEGTGYGIALGIDAGTSVATIAEVKVDKKSGNVQVKRIVCAQDMGLAINPEGATIQMEGCITMGMGYALSEDIHFKGGQIFDLNFDTYQIPKFSWLPKIETYIIDNKNAAPQGGGEPAIVTMGAVIANAIYDACGARVTQMPMTPERVLAAMKEG